MSSYLALHRQADTEPRSSPQARDLVDARRAELEGVRQSISWVNARGAMT